MRKIINNTNINNNTNIVIKGNNVVYQIISSENMEENIKENISIIYLEECAEKLKEIYEVKELLIFKMDLMINDTPPMIINYEVYHPNNFSRLNLSICEGMKITVYSPYTPTQESLTKFLKLKESGYDLYNPKDSFYQDICSTFTSDDGTDILLSDRQLDYFENISLCEDGCSYKGYDHNIEKAKCECSVKEEIKIEESKNSKNNLFSSFGLENFSNIKVIKCFKLVFSKIGQKNNKGSYIFIALILSFMIISIIFHVNQMRNIANVLRKVIESNFFNEKKRSSSFPPKKQNKRRNKKSKKNDNPTRETQKEKLINEEKKKTNFKKMNKNYKDIICFNRSKGKQSFTNISSKNKDLIATNSLRKIDEQLIESKNYTNIKKKNNYNDEELNSLSYKEALLYDKRTFFQYYWDLVKRKQLILFTFISNKDYNIFHIKLSLFLFSFSLYFTVNAVFFEDKTMHKIYKSKGSYNFLLQIPHILYSSIISSFINIIIKLLALSNKDILKIKQIKNVQDSLKESAKLSKILKIKFNLFFIISVVFLIFFWYFIAAFCAVYKNTQEILIKNTMTSFLISLLYPFGLSLLPGFFRIPSLRASKQNLECIYKFSSILAYL